MPDAPKPNGIYKQPQDDLHAARIKLVAGHITSEQLRILAGVADKHARGVIHLTTRQGVEIHDIPEADIEPAAEMLATADLHYGGSGNRVRTIIACPGIRCKFGLIDGQEIARLLDARLAGYEGLQGKFKIAISGCDNGCTSPQATCIGIIGRQHRDEDGVRREGFVLHVGGKMGRAPMMGHELPLEVRDRETLLEVCAGIVEWYRDQAEDKERFANTLGRLGMDALVAHLSATTDIMAGS